MQFFQFQIKINDLNGSDNIQQRSNELEKIKHELQTKQNIEKITRYEKKLALKRFFTVYRVPSLEVKSFLVVSSICWLRLELLFYLLFSILGRTFFPPHYLLHFKHYICIQKGVRRYFQKNHSLHKRTLFILITEKFVS